MWNWWRWSKDYISDIQRLHSKKAGKSTWVKQWVIADLFDHTEWRLTHWGFVWYICVGKQVIISKGNGLNFVWCQAIALWEPLINYYQLDRMEQTSVEIESKRNNYYSRKCISKCRLHNMDPLIQGVVSLAFRELFKIISQKYTMPEFTFIVKIS